MRLWIFRNKRELIKRISLNTWILFVVFNEILIPQDSFSRTTVTRPRIRRRKFTSIFQNVVLAIFERIFNAIMNFFRNKRELIKRISLNTWILFVVFNEILIPQDSFSRTTVTRPRIRRRKFTFISKIFILFLVNTIHFLKTI